MNKHIDTWGQMIPWSIYDLLEYIFFKIFFQFDLNSTDISSCSPNIELLKVSQWLGVKQVTRQ